MGQGSGSSSNAPQIVDEEALSLIGKRKGKAKKNKGGKKNLDMSKVKCFICHKQAHFASQCPDKKKKNNTSMAGFAEVKEFSKNFDEDFCLIACMASTTSSSIWYIDSEVSCHMTGQKRFFRSLQEGGVNLHLSWVLLHGFRRKELVLFRFRVSLANPSNLRLTYYMFRG